MPEKERCIPKDVAQSVINVITERRKVVDREVNDLEIKIQNKERELMNPSLSDIQVTVMTNEIADMRYKHDGLDALGNQLDDAIDNVASYKTCADEPVTAKYLISAVKSWWKPIEMWPEK